MGAGAGKLVQSNAGVTNRSSGQSGLNQPLQASVESSDIMSCEGCFIEFSLFQRKRKCADCSHVYCSDCLVKDVYGGNTRRRCRKCRLLSSGNFTRKDLSDFKIKELRAFLLRRNVSVENCLEKADFIEAVLKYSNNTHYRQEQEEKLRHLQELQERRRLNASRATNRDDAEDQLPESTASRADSSSATFDPSSQEDSPPSTIHAVPVPPPHAPPSYSEAQAQISQAQDNPGAENTEMDMTPDSPPQPSSANPTAQAPVRASLDQLRDVEEIEELSVRKLKEILAANFVDYKGCVEKWELMERVRRLWHSDQANRQKTEEINAAGTSADVVEDEEAVKFQEGDMCKICMDAVIDCVLLECGHMVTCTKCGRRMAECPICRQYVTRVVRIFRA